MHGSAGPAGRARPDSTPNGGDSGSNWKLYAYDLLSSVGIVILIGALLFTASGIWPPMVAVESGSMEPVMEKGDLVFVMEADRFPGPGAHESGVVTANAGAETGYEKFDGTGDVIVYQPNGDDHRTPVIHRAMFWVEEGENWVEKANSEYLGRYSSCEGANSVPNCPAPHAGFITKGDANGQYDQVNGIARRGPVKPAWVIGTAEYSIPYLGNIRLSAQTAAKTNATEAVSPNVATTANATAG
ncbi:MAG: S26 family signal peptidase [Halapricum sp.]